MSELDNKDIIVSYNRIISEIFMDFLDITWMRFDMYHEEIRYRNIPFLAFEVREEPSDKFNYICNVVEKYGCIDEHMKWVIYAHPGNRRTTYILSLEVVKEWNIDTYNNGERKCISQKDYFGEEQFRYYCDKAIEDIPRLAEWLNQKLPLFEKYRLFMTFDNQDERRECGGSCYIELCFCKLSKDAETKDILDLDENIFWQNDSLYIHGDYQNQFYNEYKEIFGLGINAGMKESLFDTWGLTYFNPEKIPGIIERANENKPEGYEDLTEWLEKAREYNGFYILGV